MRGGGGGLLEREAEGRGGREKGESEKEAMGMIRYFNIFSHGTGLLH